MNGFELEDTAVLPSFVYDGIARPRTIKYYIGSIGLSRRGFYFHLLNDMKIQMIALVLLISPAVTRAGINEKRGNEADRDTARITLTELINNITTFVSIATGDAELKPGVDREKIMREVLFDITRTRLYDKHNKLAPPANENEKILHEMLEASLYGLLSICFEKGFIPDGNVFNYARDAAIYKPLAEHTLAYFSYGKEKLEKAYALGDLNSGVNSILTKAQNINQMLHRELMHAWYRCADFADLGKQVKENIWSYYRIYLSMFRKQDYVMNKGPLSDLFGQYSWDSEEFNNIPKWITLLCEDVKPDDRQLLWDTYFHKIRSHYKWNSYYYGPAQRETCFGEFQEYLTGFYKNWNLMSEPETDPYFKKKTRGREYHYLYILPDIVMDNYRDTVTILEETAFKSEILRMVQKRLPDFTAIAFSALKKEGGTNSDLYFLWNYNLRQVDFIFNRLNVNAPELEKQFVEGLLDYMRTRASMGNFDVPNNSYGSTKDALTGYFRNIIGYLKGYAGRNEKHELIEKLDAILAAMEKDPYTAAPPHFFQDPEVLDLVKKL